MGNESSKHISLHHEKGSASFCLVSHGKVAEQLVPLVLEALKAGKMQRVTEPKVQQPPLVVLH